MCTIIVEARIKLTYEPPTRSENNLKPIGSLDLDRASASSGARLDEGSGHHTEDVESMPCWYIYTSHTQARTVVELTKNGGCYSIAARCVYLLTSASQTRRRVRIHTHTTVWWGRSRGRRCRGNSEPAMQWILRNKQTNLLSYLPLLQSSLAPETAKGKVHGCNRLHATEP
jgi:hypothetical protein